MSYPTSAAPQAPPAALLPAKPAREESLLKSVITTGALILLILVLVVLTVIAGVLAVFVVLSAFGPS